MVEAAENTPQPRLRCCSRETDGARATELRALLHVAKSRRYPSDECLRAIKEDEMGCGREEGWWRKRVLEVG